MRLLISAAILMLPFSVTAEVLTTIRLTTADPGECRRLLEGAAASGADFALVASAGEDMRTLAEARSALLREHKPVPAIGLALETATAPGDEWVASSTIRFFRQVPHAHWATLDGEPIVYLTGLHAFRDTRPLFFADLRRQFRQALGVNPHLVVNDVESVRTVMESADVKALAEEMHKLGLWTTITTILSSQEFYRAAGEQPPRLVDRIFDKWLGRSATAQERVVALERLKAIGARRFAREVVGSEESRRTVIAHWMKQYLERKEPLAVLKLLPETDTYANQLRNAGETPQTTLAHLLATELRGGDDAFVEALYAKLVRNCADKPGKTFWLKRVSTAGRETSAREFIASDVPNRVMTAEWVRELLERKSGGAADDTVALGEGSCGAMAAAQHDIVEYRRVWEELLAASPRPRLVIVDKALFDGVRQFADRFHAAH